MEEPAPQERAQRGPRLRPRFDLPVLIAAFCAAADVVSSYLLTTLRGGREANPFVAPLVEHSPYWFFALWLVFLAPMPFLPRCARHAAAAASISGNGLCAVSNWRVFLFGAPSIVGRIPFWMILAGPAALALAVFAWLAGRASRRGEPVRRALAWLLIYGAYVGAFALGFMALGRTLGPS